MGPVAKKKIVYHLVAFFIIGLIMGITEDLIAIHFSTGAEITPHVFLVAFLVALPFAFISEILIDFGMLQRIIFRNRKDEKDSQSKK